VTDSTRRRCIARLEAIGLEPFAHEIVNMDPHPATEAEHVEWILTADAAEIRYWHEQVFYP
jgi:hypothetical protein